MAEATMMTLRGERTLVRPHTDSRSPLRAWSAADQLALDHLGIDDLGSALIVNDEFGAISVGLAAYEPTVWTDSIVSRNAIDANLARNGFAPLGDRSVAGDQLPGGRYDTVVVRIPKTSALLDHQLAAIRSVLVPGARVIGTGMVRHVHRSTIDSFDRLIGPATTSRAVRKARLILTEFDVSRRPDGVLPGRGEFTTGEGVLVADAPGVFSAGHLDVGSALLLEELGRLHADPPGSPGSAVTVADLGCGNGVVGTTLAVRWPDARFVFVDASDLAVSAARRTWELNVLRPARARFAVCDALATVADATLDMVVSNPPFHQGHAVDDDLTDRLMADAARALTPSGRLVVVAQRHRHMHTRLRRWFGDVGVVSAHPTHVVVVGSDP